MKDGEKLDYWAFRCRDFLWRAVGRWDLLPAPTGELSGDLRSSPVAGFSAEDVPKKIWLYWHSGEADAPPLVQRSIASWRAHNADWDVQVLSRDDVENFVRLPHAPEAYGSVAWYSDILRFHLLNTYGGIWVDATTICVAPLDRTLVPLMKSGFFCFVAPMRYRLMSTWLLASTPGHPIVQGWIKQFSAYARNRLSPHQYFIAHSLFRETVHRDPLARDAWAVTPRLRPELSHLLFLNPNHRMFFDEMRSLVWSERVIAHKLSWKMDFDRVADDSPLFELLGPEIKEEMRVWQAARD